MHRDGTGGKMLDYSGREIVSGPPVHSQLAIFLSHQGMRKILSIARHLRCIVRKLLRGRDLGWHWQHILREFGFGRYNR
jgi:hypothetical protein